LMQLAGEVARAVPRAIPRSIGRACLRTGEVHGPGAFAAFRSIKYHPGCEVMGEVLEAVFYAGGNEERIAGDKFRTPAVDHEFATAGYDKIYFVSIVR